MFMRILIAAAVILFLILWVRAVIDVFRRGDLTGLAKAGWAVGMLILPFIGLLLYTLVRPSDAQIARHSPH
jgi:Phospholipase_D-nuclease N-terminal